MLSHEWRKQWTKFLLVFLTAMLIVNCCVCLWDLNRDSYSREAIAVRSSLLQLYREDSEEYSRLYEVYRAKNQAYEEALFSMDGMPVFENELSDLEGYGDREVFRDMETILSKDAEWHKVLQNLLYDSYAWLGGVADDSYLRRYYIELIGRYEPLYDSEIPVIQVEGWDGWFADEIPVMLGFIALAFVQSGVFVLERRSGFHQILQTTKNRRKLYLTKIRYTILTSACIGAVFTLLPLMLRIPGGRLMGGDAPLQAVEGFLYADTSLTVFKAAVLLTLVRMGLFALYGLLFAAVGWLTGSEAPSLGVALILLLLPEMTVFPHRFSIRDTITGTVFFDQYRPVNLLGYPVPLWAVTATVLLIPIVLLLSAGFCGWGMKNTVIRTRETRQGSGRCYPGVVRGEWSKTVCTGSSVLIVALFLILRLSWSAVTYSQPVTGTERVVQQYALRMAGDVSPELGETVAEEGAYIAQALNQWEGIRLAFRNGEIPYETYYTASGQYHYAFHNQAGYEKLAARYRYLEYQAQEHEKIALFWDGGIRKLMFSGLDLCTVVFLTLFISRFATVENEKFLRILRTSRYGREKTWRIKLGMMSGGVVLFWGIGLCSELLMLKCFDGFTRFDASMACFEEFHDWDLSVGGFLAIRFALILVGYLLYGGFVYGCAMMTGKLLPTMALSGVLFLPAGLCALGFDASLFNLSPVLCPTEMVHLIGYIPFLILTAVVLLLSLTRWKRGYPSST